MALTKYCSSDEVRAALGVNSDELGDAVIALPIYEIGLVRELAKVSASLPAAFLAAVDVQGPSAPQKAFVDAVHMFSAYSVAKQVGVSLATFAPKDVSDGKAGLSRFAGQPYNETMARVAEALADARAALVDAYAALTGNGAASTVKPAVHFMASGRLVDPVTGT